MVEYARDQRPEFGVSDGPLVIAEVDPEVRTVSGQQVDRRPVVSI